jgi:hypothetical protein
MSQKSTIRKMDEFRLLTQHLYNIVIAVYQKMVGFKNNKKKNNLERYAVPTSLSFSSTNEPKASNWCKHSSFLPEQLDLIATCKGVSSFIVNFKNYAL